MPSSDYIVKPVYKALQVLQRLAAEQRAMSLTEIAHRVGLPKTTTFRYLCTLCELGFVGHDPETELYRLGLYAWELGRLAGSQLQIQLIARPIMEELRDRVGETVNLGILDGTSIVYVDVVESRRSLRMQPEAGERDAVYATALGKAMLAFLPEEQWQDHLPSRQTARTTKTITNFAALKRDLRATRERGYARDYGENDEGARCVGAPIFDRRGLVVAALSVSAPASRLDDALEAQVAAALVVAATACSHRLGHGSQ